MMMTFEQVREIVARGDHANALREYVAISIRTDLTPSLRSWASYLGAVEAAQLSNWEIAVTICSAGMRDCPAMAELPWFAAYCASRAEDPLRAIAFAHMAIALADRGEHGPAPTTYPSWMRHPPAWHEGPYDVLRFAYKAIGDEKKAKWAEETYQQLQLNHRQTSVDPYASWHPEIEGWSSDILPFYERLARDRSIANIIEVGVWHGRSVLFLAEKLRMLGGLVNLFAVDINLSKFYENAGKLTDRVPIEAYELDSVEASCLIQRDFDVVFIDALHDYDSVKRDVEAWRGKVGFGGLLSGHDYMHAGQHAGVGRAVDEAFGRENVLVEGSVWQTRRTENGWARP